jgi:hypothetical protein
METVIVVAALGAGAYYVVKRRRAKRRAKAMKAKAKTTAVGWTAHQTGWLAGQVRLSIEKARAEARAQYERGRRIGGADTGSHHPPSF